MRLTGRVSRRWVAVIAALAVAGVLLLLPAPKPAARTPAHTGAPTLAEVWPSAGPVSLPATLPDGDSYSPLLVLDATSSVGYTISPDSTRTALVLLSDPAHPRTLQAISPRTGDAISAVTATAEWLYWVRSVTDERGQQHASIWSADRGGGSVHQLTADGGAAVFSNSRYDLQVVGVRLYWAAAPVVVPKVTEVRSVALVGGAVSVQTFSGRYALTSWPWLTSAIGTIGGPNELVNLLTGERLRIPTEPDQQITCTPVWCRVMVSSPAGAEIAVQRPDGRDRRRINEPGEGIATTDVALLDRFAILTAPVTADPDNATLTVVLYDLATAQRVVVAPVATGVFARGTWLCWTTGDNETLSWHLLDLTSLR